MMPKRLSRKIIHQSSWVNFYIDKVRFSDNFVVEEFYFLDFHRSAVVVIMENDHGNIIFVRVCRYATSTIEWELPNGGVEIGENVIEAAKREVLEETGFSSTNHQLIYSYYPMNGSTNKFFHIVQCKAVGQIRDFDKNEIREIRWHSKDEVKKMLADKVLADGFTLMALLMWLQKI